MDFRANGHRISTSHVAELLGNPFSVSSIYMSFQSTNRLLWVIGPSIRTLCIKLPLTTVSNLGQTDFSNRLCSFDPSLYRRTNLMQVHRPWPSRSAELKFTFPPSRNLSETCFRRTRVPLVIGQPLIFQSNWPQIKVLHVSKILGNPFSMKFGCIGCLATSLIWGKRTSDSSSARQVTPESIKTFRSYSPRRKCSVDPSAYVRTDKLYLFL